MKLRQLTQMVLAFVLVVFCNNAQASDFTTEQQKILQSISTANIIYLGEIHDHPPDHQDQLAILKYLHRRNSRLVIGLEMFQRPYQEPIDRYMAGQLTETELQQQTEYQKRWGFPWEYYAPLLRFAQKQQLPVLALNAPTEITRKVAKNGLESLTTKDFKYIPPVAEIDKSNLAYRQTLQAAFQQHQSHGHGKGFERFYEAQLLWDETMADRVATFYRQHPQYQIVVIAGQAHIKYGYGIPQRVARRLISQRVEQKTVILSHSKAPEQPPVADYIFRPSQS